MLLVAYLYGIESDRRLCEEVHFNLAYRWFCRLGLEDAVPDHSSCPIPCAGGGFFERGEPRRLVAGLR